MLTINYLHHSDQNQRNKWTKTDQKHCGIATNDIEIYC